MWLWAALIAFGTVLAASLHEGTAMWRSPLGAMAALTDRPDLRAALSCTSRRVLEVLDDPET